MKRNSTGMLKRLCIFALLAVLLAAAAPLSRTCAEEEPDWEGYTGENYGDEDEDWEDEDYEDYGGEDEDVGESEEEFTGIWYETRLSEPAGNGRGRSVTLEFEPEQGSPENGEYRWYSCNEAGEKDSLLAVTGDNRYETGEFDEPQIRWYVCELSAGGETRVSDVFAVGFTGLPTIRISTQDGEDVAYRTSYLTGTMSVLDGETAEDWNIQIKGRGNATFDYPKKPYTVKLKKKAGLLGMNRNKTWALLAGYCDKTLLRAALGFKTGELLGLEYTPGYRYVDLVLNDEYLGNYLLCETVKGAVNGAGIGREGFIVEQTHYATDDPCFTTRLRELLFRFRYPDGEDVTEAVMESVSAEINRLENTVTEQGSESEDYREIIDTDSWVNWLLVQNILANRDTNQYYYKKGSGSKIFMGPVWDFEWSVGIGWYDGERPSPEHELVIKPAYLKSLTGNRSFLQKLKDRWKEISPSVAEELTAFMDRTAREISVSRKLNFCLWRILDRKVSAGGVPLGSCEAEEECDKAYLRAHIEWLNTAIPGMEPGNE